MTTLVNRRRPVPTLVNVLDSFFNDDFIKKVEDGLTVWNGTQPAVNVKEDADAYHIEVAAPGYEKADFEVKVEEQVLSIGTEKKEETETKEGETFKRREFKYAAFQRTFNLPEHCR